MASYRTQYRCLNSGLLNVFTDEQGFNNGIVLIDSQDNPRFTLQIWQADGQWQFEVNAVQGRLMDPSRANVDCDHLPSTDSPLAGYTPSTPQMAHFQFYRPGFTRREAARLMQVPRALSQPVEFKEHTEDVIPVALLVIPAQGSIELALWDRGGWKVQSLDVMGKILIPDGDSRTVTITDARERPELVAAPDGTTPAIDGASPAEALRTQMLRETKRLLNPPSLPSL